MKTKILNSIRNIGGSLKLYRASSQSIFKEQELLFHAMPGLLSSLPMEDKLLWFEEFTFEIEHLGDFCHKCKEPRSKHTRGNVLFNSDWNWLRCPNGGLVNWR